MSAVIDKERIIEAIRQSDDERILFAIGRLLQIDDEEIPEWHKEIVEQRWKEMKEGKVKFQKWEDVKNKIFNR